MAWLLLGALLLLLAVPARGGKAVDSTGVAAIAGFAATAWRALSVYPPGKVAPIALAWAAAMLAMLLLGRRRAAPLRARWALLALGAASSLFALFGPADGLF